MVRIVPLNPRELIVAQQLHAILRHAHELEARLTETQPTVELLETVEEIQSTRGYFIGAFDDDDLVGFLSIGADDEPDQISIDTLVVDQSHQRRGIASLLLADALSRGRGMTFSVSTGAANLPALCLYEKAGFTQYRRGTIGPEEHALVKLRKSAP